MKSHQENLFKRICRVGAVEITLYCLLDDRSEVSVLLLEAALIFGQEPFEVMEEHPVESGAL